LEETSTPGKNQRPFITLTNFYHIKMYHHWHKWHINLNGDMT
jgi:hypothetical protein